MDGRVLAILIAAAALLLIYFVYTGATAQKKADRTVIVLGFDGMDARLAEQWMDEGKLPNLARLRAMGTYSRIQTTTPADTPVAWTTVATGLNPGKHNVLDFLDRDPATYMPRIALIKKEETGGGKPLVFNLKQGEPIWKTVSDNGGRSTVITVPVTFPAEDFDGKMLSGLGTPDIRGTWGTFTAYVEGGEGGDSLMGGNFVPVEFEGGVASTELRGPKEMAINMTITRTADGVKLSFGGKEYALKQGEWSEWADIQFEANPFVKVKGTGRFYLISTDPLSLYLMPVSLDPRDPFFRISTPEWYSRQVAEDDGLYKTVGWADDTWALNDDAIDEQVFLQDAYRTLEQKEKLVLDEMEEKPDLLMAVFYQTDTVQHMFYRYMDPENPLYGSISPEEKERHKDEILRVYQRMDEAAGKVMSKAGQDDVIIVMSDHGFNPFRKAVNLNTWLANNGFLAKKPGANTSYYKLNSLYGEQGLFWNDVLLNETQAYSMGLGNIYINLKGREAQGAVGVERYDAVRDRIIRQLKELRDPETGEKVIADAQKREDLYSGPYMDNAADIVVSFNPGYRVSWQTSLGGVPPHVIEPNLKKWSGDHCTVDPKQTEGVFFVNRVMGLDGEPSLQDVNPTLRSLLGLPANESLDGMSMLRDGNETAGPEAGCKDCNVLVITMDDVRADYLPLFNPKALAETPNLEALASKSVLFTNAHTAFTFTCPSHTIMMTGRYFTDDDRQTSLPRILKGNGYATGATVGFAGLRQEECPTGAMFGYYDESSTAIGFGERDDNSAAQAMTWLQNHSKGRFFFWLHLYDAHPFGKAANASATGSYSERIGQMDGHIGEVLALLDRQNLTNKTIVVVLSDHGMGADFAHPANNRQLYDLATHVPMMIYVPGGAPARAEGLTSTVDLAPTLAALLGVHYADADGAALLDADGTLVPGSARDHVFATYRALQVVQHMVRTNEWKYIVTMIENGNTSYELYNLAQDPAESRNLYGSQPEIEARLRGLLQGYPTAMPGRLRGLGMPGAMTGWYGTTTATPMSNQTRDELRSLGYIN
ncbi:MAG: alkaline phosphatase family protein [Candidatus ainarchaeum sp.]|nr:alkaline phosphatase family protein [Candidatus ainarchaeum sp.]